MSTPALRDRVKHESISSDVKVSRSGNVLLHRVKGERPSAGVGLNVNFNLAALQNMSQGWGRSQADDAEATQKPKP